ncbi:MAG: hypothetical protein IJZ35_03750 [Clostridia bacterium]|nr:hypothetical protein [Clostridia bacterium]
MKTITKRILLLVAVACIFLAVVALLMFSMLTNANEYALKSVNKHIYDSNILTNAGDIVDVNGKVMATTSDGERIYNESSSIRTSLLHIIGDDKGFISGGIQDTFSSELSGYSILYGINRESSNTLNLTLDADLCAYAYEQLKPYKGTIAVCNYKTGELVCIATSPSYDMYNKPSDIDTNEKYDGVYINRFYGGLYTPGSVLKVVTAMSAVENISDIYTRTFKCEGSYTLSDGGKIVCNDTHGTISFEQALNRSCNVAFAMIAVELGEEKLNAAFSAAGLDKSHTTSDRIRSYAGSFGANAESSVTDIGWSGVGQSTTLVNPYAFLTYMCAIANGGVCNEPYFISSVTNADGKYVYRTKAVDSGINISSTTASTLKAMLRSTVSNYYGDYRFGNLTICGKTGTAERDNEKPHAWFAGFSADEEFPYAVVAVLENSGNGLTYAGTAASNVLQKLYKTVN